eukprot:5947636-Prymnesium_polylepis.1
MDFEIASDGSAAGRRAAAPSSSEKPQGEREAERRGGREAERRHGPRVRCSPGAPAAADRRRGQPVGGQCPHTRRRGG